jgi:transposase InsO family protein
MLNISLESSPEPGSVDFLPDSGSACGVVGELTFEAAPDEIKDEFAHEELSQPINFRFGNDKVLSSRTAVRAVDTDVVFVILPGVYTPFIVGMDILKGSSLNFCENSLTVFGAKLPLRQQKRMFTVDGARFIAAARQCFELYLNEDVFELDNYPSEFFEENKTIYEKLDVPALLKKSNITKLHARHLHCTASQLEARYKMILTELNEDDRKTFKRLAHEVTTECKICAQRKKPHASAATGNIVKIKKPGVVSADTIFVHVGGKKIAIIHFVDVHTKYSTAVLCKGSMPTAKDTIRGLIDFHSRVGYMPHALYTDNGAEFINKLVQKFCADNGIMHTKAPAGIHRSNGFVESHNFVLKRILYTLSLADYSSVYLLHVTDLLNAALLAKNAHVRSVGFSSYFQVHGREPHWGIVANIEAPDDYVEQHRALLAAASKLTNIEAELQDLHSVLTGSQHRPFEAFEQGERVYVLPPDLKYNDLGKPRWQPAQIVGLVPTSKRLVVQFSDGVLANVHSSRTRKVVDIEGVDFLTGDPVAADEYKDDETTRTTDVLTKEDDEFFAPPTRFTVSEPGPNKNKNVDLLKTTDPGSSTNIDLLGSTSNKKVKTIDMEKLDPKVYSKPLEVPTSSEEWASQKDDYSVRELRWITKHLGLNLANGRKPMIDRISSHFAIQQHQNILFADVDCMFPHFANLVDSSELPEACMVHLVSLGLGDYYDLLRTQADATHHPGDNIFRTLTDTLHNADRDRVSHIVTRSNVAKVPHFKFERGFDVAPFLLKPHQSAVPCKAGDFVPRNGILVAFCLHKDVDPSVIKQILDPKSKGGIPINLPIEMLTKGTIELPFSFFVENDLVELLFGALSSEFGALRQWKTYEVRLKTDFPNQKYLTSRIIWAIKIDLQTRMLKRVKCRFVPRGFYQNDRRAPAVRKDISTVCQESLILSLACYCRPENSSWKIRITDYKNAFLQGELLDEKLQVKCEWPELSDVPDEYLAQVREIIGYKPGTLMNFLVPCYGLIDAPRNWHRTLTKSFRQKGFVEAKSDPGMWLLYTRKGEIWSPPTDLSQSPDAVLNDRRESVPPLPSDVTLEGIADLHVDDALTMGSEAFYKVFDAASARFKIGEAEDEPVNDPSWSFTYCGRHITRNLEKDGKHIALDQEAYARGMIQIPVPKDMKLSDTLEPDAHSEYRQLLGRVSWLAYRTRPDIAFDTWVSSKASASPTWTDALALNKLARRASHDRGIELRLGPTTGTLRVIALPDCSYNRTDPSAATVAGQICGLTDYTATVNNDLVTQGRFSDDAAPVKSYRFIPVYWRSSEIKRRVDNVYEGELFAARAAYNFATYVHALATELKLCKNIVPLVYCDNHGVVKAVKSNNRLKTPRLNVEFATIRRLFTDNEFMLAHIPTELNIGDALTKTKSPLTELLKKTLQTERIWLPEI